MEDDVKQYAFDDTKLEIGRPVEIGRSVGHFWFPSLHPIGTDELFCLVNRGDDKAQGEWPAEFHLSRDGGQSWHHVHDGIYGPNSVLLEPGKLLMMPYELWPTSPGDRRNCRADGTVVTRAGNGSLSFERREVRFLDFPHDLEEYHEDELRMHTNGNILPLKNGRLFTTLYGAAAGQERYSVYGLTSEDGGFTWRFLSIVASPEGEADLEEGPDENNTVRLADGRLLCVYRVGGMKEFRKSYSADEGVTWTAPARVEGAWSVEPQLVRLECGLLLLTGGRPGLLLWACSDGKGESWNKISLAAHHNDLMAEKGLHYENEVCDGSQTMNPPQSTSYTGMKRTGTNEALICYDRLANGWSGAPGPWGEEDAVFCVRVRADG
mgnify:CR=1 FL=1